MGSINITEEFRRLTMDQIPSQNDFEKPQSNAIQSNSSHGK